MIYLQYLQKNWAWWGGVVLVPLFSLLSTCRQGLDSDDRQLLRKYYFDKDRSLILLGSLSLNPERTMLGQTF